MKYTAFLSKLPYKQMYRLPFMSLLLGFTPESKNATGLQYHTAKAGMQGHNTNFFSMLQQSKDHD